MFEKVYIAPPDLKNEITKKNMIFKLLQERVKEMLSHQLWTNLIKNCQNSYY